ncbi:MAG: response regulator [Pseudomonadota bacterium]
MSALAAKTISDESDADPLAKLGVRPISCLLLDDSRFDRRRVVHTANRAGLKIDVVECATVAEARKILAQQNFSLHIFDYRLPDGDGIAFAKEVLADAKHKMVPTIILSGKGHENTSISAIMAGCADYLTKDLLSPGTFHHSVINALHKAALRAERDEEDQDKDAIRAVLDALCDAHLDVMATPLADLRDRAEALKASGDASSDLQKAIDTLTGKYERINGQLSQIEDIAKRYRD